MARFAGLEIISGDGLPKTLLGRLESLERNPPAISALVSAPLFATPPGRGAIGPVPAAELGRGNSDRLKWNRLAVLTRFLLDWLWAIRQ